MRDMILPAHLQRHEDDRYRDERLSDLELSLATEPMSGGNADTLDGLAPTDFVQVGDTIDGGEP